MTVCTAYVSARRAAALIDRSGRGKIVVTGADRASYLQGLLTNDVEGLSTGEGCYAVFLTPQGRVDSDAQVFHLGEELFLDVHPSVTATLAERLREFVFTEDVTVRECTDQWAAFGVHGPEAADLVIATVRPGLGSDRGPVDAAQLAELPEYHHRSGRFRGAPVVVVRSGEIGEVGFVLYVASAHGSALRDALFGAGAVELDAAAFDTLRIEAGRPLFPDDLDPETIPLEAAIEDRAVSMTKGCYVGQEVIVRILHRGKGRVARRLVGLCFEPSTDPPRRGAVLSAGGAGAGGAGGSVGTVESVGKVTSAAWSPALGRPIALGYVKRELAEPGTAVTVHEGARRCTGTVVARPFLPVPSAG